MAGSERKCTWIASGEHRTVGRIDVDLYRGSAIARPRESRLAKSCVVDNKGIRISRDRTCGNSVGSGLGDVGDMYRRYIQGVGGRKWLVIAYVLQENLGAVTYRFGGTLREVACTTACY
jgi:hypothetical protein